jgi:hypothetical protein
MKTTKDQRDLTKVLELAIEARDAAYALFSKRLDTQRNVDSFIGLRDAFNALKTACEILESSVVQATAVKAADQYSLMTEIMVRSGRATVIEG